ncbi:DUF934 domain-containing protein [Arenibacterium sp. CAU 1754]
MTVIVTDTGFAPEDWTDGFTTVGDCANDLVALDIGPETDVTTLTAKLPALRMIRVDFPNFADGRGFTIARQIRLCGYSGRLRARGHVLADQYAMARRSGFDEVEIDDALAARQPEHQWLARANWKDHDHQDRLRG